MFAVFMVITGLALNHSHQLGLDQRHISQAPLLSWYGLDEPGQMSSFAVGEFWVTFAGSRLYLDNINVATTSDGIGAVNYGDWVIAAGKEELLLLNRDGVLIERLPWGSADTGPIEAIGRFENGAIVVVSTGQLWLADSELLNWEPIEAQVTTPSWSTGGHAPAAMQRAIVRDYQGSSLSLEQFLLDIHSGRIFGTPGVLVYDLVALTLGFLALSGLLLWLRGQRNGRP